MGHRTRTVIAVVAAIVATLAAFAGVAWWWANHQFNQIPTFDDPLPSAQQPATPTPEQDPPSGAEGITTIAVISVGSAGIDTADSERLRIGTDRLVETDGLTDTIALVAIDATHRHVTVLSIPRDTWSDTHRSKINAVYNTAGAGGLAAELSALTGIGIDHMVAANFSAVADIVDALDGVWATTGVEVRDTMSGLHLDGTCTRLDGAAALAWSRSRHLEYRDGTRWRTDPSGDLGRTERQQQLGAALIANTGWASLTSSAPALLDVAAENLTRDENLTLGVVARLGVALRAGAELETITPDAEPSRHGRASTVTITDAGAATIAELAARIAAGDLSTPSTPTEPNPAGPAPSTTAPSTPAPSTSAPSTTGAPPETPGTGADTRAGDGTALSATYTKVTLRACEPPR